MANGILAKQKQAVDLEPMLLTQKEKAIIEEVRALPFGRVIVYNQNYKIRGMDIVRARNLS